MGVRSGKLWSLLLVVALVSSMVPGTAFGVVNLGSATVSLPGSVSLTSGTGTAVSAPCSPAYSDQIPNCMNDYCPSGCDFGMTGTGTACQDKGTGQCTCYGYGYSRHFPSCTVSSSDPSVARASWGNDTLSIQGYRAGTATITVYPSLRLFSSVPSSITVTVGEAVSESGASGGTTGGSSGNASTGSGSGSAGASVAPAASPQSAGVVSVISSIAGSNPDAGDGVEAASAEDTYRIGDEGVSVPELLKSVAGTDKVLSLWGGDNAEAPQYIWQIPGSKLSADDNLNLDLAVTDEAASNAQLASLLDGIGYAAFRIAQGGELPGTMQLFWRTANELPNDAVVDVYTFDDESGTFAKAYSNLKTAEGYICFNAAVGGTYVVSDDSDLESGGISTVEQATFGGDSGKTIKDPADASASWALYAVGAVVAVTAMAVVVALIVRKRRMTNAVAGAFGEGAMLNGDGVSGEEGSSTNVRDDEQREIR